VLRTTGLLSSMSEQPSTSGGTERENKARRRSEHSRSNKRAKIANEVFEELTCPLTLELCVDPVMAEDGHLYERNAIVSYFEHCQRASLALKSPVNNVPMGPMLTPAPHVSSIIERVLTSGALHRTDVAAWRQRAFDVSHVQPLIKRIDNGDVHAMHTLGCVYYRGTLHVKSDYKAAFKWYCEGSDRGHICSLAMKSKMLLEGKYCTKDTTQGLIGAAFSAGAGSLFSHYTMGHYFELGEHKHAEVDQTIRYWYERVVNHEKYELSNDASADLVALAQKWLDKHPKSV